MWGLSFFVLFFFCFYINFSRALRPILPYLKGTWFYLATKKSKKGGEVGEKKREN